MVAFYLEQQIYTNFGYVFIYRGSSVVVNNKTETKTKVSSQPHNRSGFFVFFHTLYNLLKCERTATPNCLLPYTFHPTTQHIDHTLLHVTFNIYRSRCNSCAYTFNGLRRADFLSKKPYLYLISCFIYRYSTKILSKQVKNK